jgi:hypothetical protein
MYIMHTRTLESRPFDGQPQPDSSTYEPYAVDGWWFVSETKQDPERAAQLALQEFNQLIDPEGLNF